MIQGADALDSYGPSAGSYRPLGRAVPKASNAWGEVISTTERDRTSLSV